MSVHISATTGRSNKHLTADAFQNNGQPCSREVYTGTQSHEGEYNTHNAIAGMRPLGRPVTVILAKSAARVYTCVYMCVCVLCLKQEKPDSSCSDISRMLTAPHKLTMEENSASIININYKETQAHIRFPSISKT